MHALPSLSDAGDLTGKKVLVRVDFNVPCVGEKVVDDLRIVRTLPLIHFLVEKKAKVILISHIGRDPHESLRPVFEYLKEKIHLSFVESVVGEKVREAIDVLHDGDVLLLENLRQEEGENNNDPAFAKTLASYGDIYVNEAFPVSHRDSASIVGVPKILPHYAGPEFLEEVEKLSLALSPKHPALFILGGAKFETKRPLIQKFLALYDTVFVGGALANDFLKAQGYEVGRSVISSDVTGIEDLFLEQKLLLPCDVIVATEDGEAREKDSRSVLPTEIIYDAGTETAEVLREKIAEASFVLWNGPFGMYERGYTKTTKDVAEAIAERGTMSIVGGGDTVASIAKLHLEDKFTFLSSAGGAMLDFLVEGTLPGIEALRA